MMQEEMMQAMSTALTGARAVMFPRYGHRRRLTKSLALKRRHSVADRRRSCQMKYIRIIVSAASIPIYFYIFLYLLYDWVVAAFIFGAFFIGSRLMDVLEQIVLFFLSV